MAEQEPIITAKMSTVEKGRIVNALREQSGATLKAIADKLEVNYNSARRWVSVARAADGETTPIPPEQTGATPEEERDAKLPAIEELIHLAQAVRADFDPVIDFKDIYLPHGPAAILFAGCMQAGGRWTYHSMIREKLEQVLSLPCAYVGFFGDEIENFKSGSFAGAASVHDQAIMPDTQRCLWELFMEWLHEHKCILWGTWSQHGTVWDRKDGFSYIKETYTKRNIPFFDGQAYLKVHVGDKQVYNVAVSHEFPGKSIYNPVHPQKRALFQRFPNADIIAQADQHQYALLKERVYGNEYRAGNRASPWATLLQIGTAKTGPDPYTIRGWERGIGEWPWIILSEKDHRVEVTENYDMLEPMLQVLGYKNGKPSKKGKNGGNGCKHAEVKA